MLLKKLLWTVPFFCFLLGYWLPYLLFTTDTTQVPHLVGKSSTMALELASQANLSIKLIRTQEDTTLAPGTVIFQTPAPERNVRPHQTILIITSQKPHEQTVPACIGLPTDQATNILTALELPYTIVPVPSDTNGSVIIAQYPPAGSSLEQKKLLLYVGSDSKKVLMPLCTGHMVCTIYDLFSLYGCTLNIEHDCQETSHSCRCIITEHKPLFGSFIDLSKPPIVYLKAKR